MELSEEYGTWSMATIASEVLAQIVNLIEISGIEKLVAIGSRLLLSKLFSPSLYLSISSKNAYGVCSGWSKILLSRLKGIRDITLHSRLARAHEVIMTLPPSVTSLSWVYRQTTDTIEKEWGSTTNGLLSIAGCVPGLTTLKIEVLHAYKYFQQFDLRTLPRTLTNLQIRNSNPGEPTDYLEGGFNKANESLFQLPVTLCHLTLPLKENNLLEWIFHFPSLETLELPCLVVWPLPEIDPQPHTSIKRLMIPKLRVVHYTTAVKNAHLKLSLSALIQRGFPSLTSIQAYTPDLSDWSNYPLLQSATWTNASLPTEMVFRGPPMLKYLDLSRLDKHPLPLDFISELSGYLTVLKLPFLVENWVFTTLPSALTSLTFNYPKKPSICFRSTLQVHSSLRQFGDMRPFPRFEALALTSSVLREIEIFPNLEFCALLISQTRTWGLEGTAELNVENASAFFYRFPNASRYIGLDHEHANGWITWSEACRWGRVDLLDKMLISNPYANPVLSGVSTSSTYIIQTASLDALEWMMDNGLEPFDIVSCTTFNLASMVVIPAVKSDRLEVLQLLNSKSNRIKALPDVLRVAATQGASLEFLEFLLASRFFEPHCEPLPPRARWTPFSPEFGYLASPICSKASTEVLDWFVKHNFVQLDMAYIIHSSSHDQWESALEGVLHLVDRHPNRIELRFGLEPLNSAAMWKLLLGIVFPNHHAPNARIAECLDLLSRLGLNLHSTDAKKPNARDNPLHFPATLLCRIRWEVITPQNTPSDDGSQNQPRKQYSAGIDFAKWMIKENLPFTLGPHANRPFEHLLLETHGRYHMDLILFLLNQGKLDYTATSSGRNLLQVALSKQCYELVEAIQQRVPDVLM